MGRAVRLRSDYSSGELQRLARASKGVRKSSPLLSLAAVLEGMGRSDAARIGGMDRRTLRDWAHRFNEAGPEGFVDQWSPCLSSRLSVEQQAELAAIVKKGPDRAIDGVVRWWRVDLTCVVKERVGVNYDTRYRQAAVLARLREIERSAAAPPHRTPISSCLRARRS